ncbi:GatB/YqeY domain-containing protein [Oleidesulfovibrio sp.]|uniref:GatB/YqeY domain-containing protein n=1 Tax=Oleidesulfovibrio sp. TaxID=2909707 RepID=UPI003A84CE92
MTLSSRIESDYITAYKAKNSLKLGVLRLLKTAVKNLQVEKMRPLTEDEIFDVLMRQVKQRQDSIEQFENANRQDLADKEAAELTVLQEYMPAQLGAEELAAAVDKAIADSGAASMQDMGKVMSAIMAEYKGRVDGKELSGMVRSKLQALS